MGIEVVATAKCKGRAEGEIFKASTADARALVVLGRAKYLTRDVIQKPREVVPERKIVEPVVQAEVVPTPVEIKKIEVLAEPACVVYEDQATDTVADDSETRTKRPRKTKLVVDEI